jgi:hypothetical protein
VTVHRTIVSGFAGDLGRFDHLTPDCGDLVEVDIGLIVTPGRIEQIANLGHRAVAGDRGDLVSLQIDGCAVHVITGTMKGSVATGFSRQSIQFRREGIVRPQGNLKEALRVTLEFFVIFISGNILPQI